MIVNRNNLEVVKVSMADRGIPVLDNVRFERDGSSVACGNGVVIAVGGVDPRVREKVVVKDSGECAVTMSSETVREVIKNLPRDKKFDGLLEHVDVDGVGKFTCHDGKRERVIVGRRYDREYVPYRREFVRVKREAGVRARAVVNLQRMRLLLETLEKVVGDGAKANPIWMEMTERGDLLLRGRNMVTGQRAVGLLGVAVDQKWLKEDSWERGLYEDERLENSPERKKRAIRHKKNASRMRKSKNRDDLRSERD